MLKVCLEVWSYSSFSRLSLDPDVHLKMLHCVSISAAVLTLLILTAQSTAQVDNCSSLASTGNCSFYDCLSTKFECNTSGYLIGFGKNYCLRYANKSSCFTTSVSLHFYCSVCVGWWSHKPRPKPSIQAAYIQALNNSFTFVIVLFFS